MMNKSIELKLVEVPPPEAAPVFPLSIEYGVLPFLCLEEGHTQFRCANCSQMQKAGSPIVWVSDFTVIDDPVWAHEETARRNAFNGHSSGWCISCAKKIGKKQDTIDLGMAALVSAWFIFTAILAIFLWTLP